MGLTWRDLVSSATMVAIVFVYVGYQSGPGMPLVLTASVASAIALVLAACCALAAAWDLHTRPQRRWGLVARRITTVMGTIALVAGLTGLVAGSGRALEFLVVAIVLLWLTATWWHIMSLGSDQEH